MQFIQTSHGKAQARHNHGAFSMSNESLYWSVYVTARL